MFRCTNLEATFIPVDIQQGYYKGAQWLSGRVLDSRPREMEGHKIYNSGLQIRVRTGK